MLPYFAPSIAGVSMLLLAGWLLNVSPERRQARAFAILLAVRGFALIALSVSVTSSSLEMTRMAAAVYPALCLATAFAVVYFVAVFPAPRSFLPRGMFGPAVFIGPPVLVGIILFFDPNLERPLEALTNVGPAAMMQWKMTTPAGPIGIAPTLLDLTLTLPAFVLMRDFLSSAPGRKRSTLLIVSFGFFAPAACSCLMAGAFMKLRGNVAQPSDPSVFNFVEMAIFGAWFIVMAALLIYLGIRAKNEPEPAGRRAAVLFAAVISFSTLIGAAAGSFPDPQDSVRAIFVMVAFWSGLGAVAVTYGVIRHALFDIDVKFKLTFQRSTVAAVFVTVYFLVSEIAAQLFEDFSGSAYLGIAAAGLLLVIINRIERIVSVFVDGSMPNTKPLSELDDEESIAFYHDQVELMWMDGVLTPKDRLVLANLRTKLQLGAETAEKIELEIIGTDSS